MKLNFGNSSQRVCKSRYQRFLVLSSFTGSLSFVPNMWSVIVWVNKFLVGHMSAHSSLSFNLLSFSIAFSKSLKELESNSVALKFQIPPFCICSICHVWFRTKFYFRKLWTFLNDSFLIKQFFYFFFNFIFPSK